jgi:predicted transcriptional regulator
MQRFYTKVRKNNESESLSKQKLNKLLGVSSSSVQIWRKEENKKMKKQKMKNLKDETQDKVFFEMVKQIHNSFFAPRIFHLYLQKISLCKKFL